MNITKKHISANISLQCDIPFEESKNFVNALFLIQKNVLKSQNIKISKFGLFYRKISPKRIGRNPKTLEEYPIEKQSKISFKASNIIKNTLN